MKRHSDRERLGVCVRERKIEREIGCVCVCERERLSKRVKESNLLSLFDTV